MKRVRQSRWQCAATAARCAAVGAIALAALIGGVTNAAGQELTEKPWEIAPYRVLVTMAVNDARRPAAELAPAMERAVIDRVAAGLRPWWRLELRQADDPAARRQCFDPRELAWDDLPGERTKYDKLFWLGVVATPTGYQVACREFDVLTRRWGAVQRRDVAQRVMLGEATFDALTAAFAPLALVESTADDARVHLSMKAGALPRPPAADRLVAPGDAFLPVLRRTRRGGQAADAGITILPWTYLLAAQEAEGGWDADVETAMRRPFAAPRRGMVQQLAVGLRRPPGPAKVRFFARSNRDQPLVGYEAFRAAVPGETPQRVGVTNRDGVIEIPVGDRAATTLLLRSDGQVLAKLVVAAGVADVLDAPIADDAIRLAAQAEVQAVREELVDLVARRAIMMARVKGLLKQKKVDEARTLMSDLSGLPTPSTFANRINAARDRLPTSEDPRVRQTVATLFSSTEELLGRFLDVRAVTNLQAEVNEAARSGT